MTVKSKVKTKTIFICVSIMSPISNPRPYLTHSRCHYLLYFAKVCFSPCLRYLFMRLCVWHCISLSEKPGKKEVGGGGMTKWVSKFIATPVDRGLRIGGSADFFSHSQMNFLLLWFRPGRCASVCQVSHFNCRQTKVKSQLQLDLAKFTFHHGDCDCACAANLRAKKI